MGQEVEPAAALVQRLEEHLAFLRLHWRNEPEIADDIEQAIAALRGGGSSPTGETRVLQQIIADWRQSHPEDSRLGKTCMRCRVACADALDAALAPICSECTEPGSLPENVVRMEPAFICPTPTCDNYALAVAPSSQATPPATTECCDAAIGGDCRFCPKCGWEARIKAASSPATGAPRCEACRDGECPLHLGTPSHLGAAPSSSPAPSGQKKDKEKADTRSPSPDVIPATGSPRSPQPGDSSVAICRICQMRLPERLVTFAPGPRGGIDAVCAADCRAAGLPVDEEKRAEVIERRRRMIRAGGVTFAPSSPSSQE
jgi:hypothetical protein